MLKLEYVNECIFLFACYHLVLFTNLLGKDDPYTPEHIGISMIITVILMLLITALAMVFLTVKGCFNKIKPKIAKKKQQKVNTDNE